MQTGLQRPGLYKVDSDWGRHWWQQLWGYLRKTQSISEWIIEKIALKVMSCYPVWNYILASKITSIFKPISSCMYWYQVTNCNLRAWIGLLSTKVFFSMWSNGNLLGSKLWPPPLVLTHPFSHTVLILQMSYLICTLKCSLWSTKFSWV